MLMTALESLLVSFDRKLALGCMRRILSYVQVTFLHFQETEKRLAHNNISPVSNILEACGTYLLIRAKKKVPRCNEHIFVFTVGSGMAVAAATLRVCGTGKTLGSFYWKYKGSAKEIRRAKRAGKKFGAFY